MSIAEQILGLLRSAAAADPAAIEKLLETRVPCNQAMVDHPTIIVGGLDPNKPGVGMLGFLNGLLDIHKERIAMVVGSGPVTFKIITPETCPAVFEELV
jgi:hypothetical protein